MVIITKWLLQWIAGCFSIVKKYNLSEPSRLEDSNAQDCCCIKRMQQLAINLAINITHQCLRQHSCQTLSWESLLTLECFEKLNSVISDWHLQSVCRMKSFVHKSGWTRLSSTLQKQVDCLNDRVVALVADKLERVVMTDCFGIED